MAFLQTDPIPGGSANSYDYCSQDPINCTDLNGQFGWSSIGHFFKKAAHYAKRAFHGAVKWASNPRTWVNIATGVGTAVFVAGCVAAVACGAAMAATGLAAIYIASAGANIAVSGRRGFTYRSFLAPLRPMATGGFCGGVFGSGCASAAWRVSKFLFGRWG